MSGIGRRTLLGGAGLALSLPTLARPARGLAATAKPRVVLKTDHGTIVVELEDRRAPLTSQNFLRYVDAGKYDDGAFYRAARTPGVPGDGTIVARPSAKSHPFPPIGHESTTMTGLRHRAGTISLGRFAPGSATADFFICAADEPYLDAHPEAKGDNLGYAAFGQVVSGMGTVKRILAAHCSRKAPFPEQRGQWLDPPVAILSAKRAA